MTADISELGILAARIARAGAEVEREAAAVVSRGALNIKNDWRANAARSAGRHARLYPSTIGYDLHVLPGGGARAVIGPDKDLPQGPLGNILEYGTARQAGHNDGGRALTTEEPRFLAQVARLGGELL
ncbi:hypothetical protein F4556_002362 [Kitasatospora gansuensis]|uniref:HK97 gp10 family phage protein n=1 Tax=Kitasatospora gansuensis TaxID=258050 RepID=A0A7W7WGH9_9ACTN|nr:hypothetical protein [Kitasatospora gansuensis]MBB4946827.1 hypothetical protein [Kitasatospora gansuensis]